MCLQYEYYNYCREACTCAVKGHTVQPTGVVVKWSNQENEKRAETLWEKKCKLEINRQTYNDKLSINYSMVL